jgi:6-phosphogluconolactonase (cycloisomerase 2 family)
MQLIVDVKSKQEDLSDATKKKWVIIVAALSLTLGCGDESSDGGSGGVQSLNLRDLSGFFLVENTMTTQDTDVHYVMNTESTRMFVREIAPKTCTDNIAKYADCTGAPVTGKHSLVEYMLDNTGAWVVSHQIFPSAQPAGTSFFASNSKRMALSDDGKVLVVGAPQDSSRDSSHAPCSGINAAGCAETTSFETASNADGYHMGAVYVYRFNETNSKWEREAFIKSPSVATGFNGFQLGSAVALSGDGRYFAVSEPYNSINSEAVVTNETNSTAINNLYANADSSDQKSRAGAVQIYHYDTNNSEWTLTAVFTNNTDNEQFGQKLVINQDGSRVVVGPNNQHNTYRTYTREDNWEKEADLALVAVDTSTSIAMDASGTTLVIGTIQRIYKCEGVIPASRIDACVSNYTDNAGRDEMGAAQVYRFDTNTATWGLEAALTSETPIADANLGGHVAISPDGQYIVASQVKVPACMGVFSNFGACQAAVSNATGDLGGLHVFRKTSSLWAQSNFIGEFQRGDTADIFAEGPLYINSSRLLIPSLSGGSADCTGFIPNIEASDASCEVNPMTTETKGMIYQYTF